MKEKLIQVKSEDGNNKLLVDGGKTSATIWDMAQHRTKIQAEEAQVQKGMTYSLVSAPQVVSAPNPSPSKTHSLDTYIDTSFLWKDLRRTFISLLAIGIAIAGSFYFLR